ncbi:hypothetical protein QZG57_09675 [Corynebacterium glucuronolyticum]|uniref:hypothetical protein n=1 Tax=Corynebacterium glucuronolyticum TaxID=39791 RepID=UPI003F6E32AB
MVPRGAAVDSQAPPARLLRSQRPQHGLRCGNWSAGTEFEVEKPYRQSDLGHNFYAGQTLAPGGRVTLFAWMGDFSHPIETQVSGWSGRLAVPRDLGLNAELEVTLPTSVAEAVELCFSTFTGTPFATVGYDSLAGMVFLRRCTPETPWSTGYRATPVEGDTVHRGFHQRLFLHHLLLRVHPGEKRGNGGHRPRHRCRRRANRCLLVGARIELELTMA